MRHLRSIATSIVLVCSAIGCTTSAPPVAQAAPPKSDPGPAAVERVTDASLVCMVNDQFMGAVQVPVKVADKTYYGCCEACRERLLTDASLRTARDPVTQEPVDKATAVLGRAPGGTILYFASEATLRRYRP